MKKPGLRARVLMVALLPAALVAVVMAVVYFDRYVVSLEEGLRARALAETKQMAGAAEFGVFSANRELLQALTQTTQAGDADIVSAAIYDRGQVPLASVGASAMRPNWSPPASGERATDEGSRLMVIAAIRPTALPIEDVYSGLEPFRPLAVVEPAAIGYAVLEFSRERLDAERRRQIGIGLGISIVGLLLAVMLALRIARGITRPLLHMTQVVERIGNGETEARVTPDEAQTMPTLEAGINRMAERIGYTQDYLLSEIDAATAELRERTEEAEQANNAKSRFLAAASHDLRQPLHAMGLFVTRLTQLPMSGEAQALARQTETSVLALQDLLDTLLDISRLDARLVEPKLSDFPVADMLNRFAAEYAGQAAGRGLRLRVRSSGLWLHTDPHLLGRILMNLLGNALRYTDRGGVLLACRRRGDHALIQVVDTGIGIPQEQLQNVFSEYVQLANPERNRTKGLGLGLAICDRLAQLLELPLGVRSRVGHGSAFWLEVPLGQAHGDERSDDAEMSAVTLKGTVLVIEDDALVAAGLTELLAGWGCRVFCGRHVEEAVSRCDAARARPDVAICDYRLGEGRDGIASAQAVRRRYGPVPVLLTSGSADLSTIPVLPGDGYVLLTKPVRPGKLRATLHSLLAKPQTETDSASGPVA